MRHPFIPELLALEAPRLIVHLRPFGTRIDFDVDAAEIDPTGATAGIARRAAALALIARAIERVDDAQLLAGPIRDRAVIRRDAEVDDVRRDREMRLLVEVVRDE